MTRQELSLTADDGKPLHVIGWLPEGEVRAVVQVVHGVAEHGSRYAHVAEALNADGIAVWTHDHRGHGATDLPQDYGFVADNGGWDLLIHDIKLVDDHVRAVHPGVRRCLFGHSMGSMLVQDVIDRRPRGYDAVVLSGTQMGGGPLPYAGWLIGQIECRRQGPRGVSPILKGLSFQAWNREFKPTATEFDWISRDSDAVAAYAADPACGFDLSNALWLDLIGAALRAGNPQAVNKLPKDLPILLLTGDEDPSNGHGKLAAKLAQRYRSCGLTEVTFRSYPGARHEVVNETNREEVLADLREWLRVHLLAAPAEG